MAELPTSVFMFIASRSAENRIVAAVRGAGYDFTLAQARIGARIGPNGSRLTDLAEQAQVTKQTAKAIVDKLEAAGFVERTPDPADGRARLIRVSEKALTDVVPIARAEEAAIEREWTEHLGEQAMAQLRESLIKLREITDPYRES